MEQAVKTARNGIDDGESPFGAVVARSDGHVIVAAHNSVRHDGDITAHAEINAIRKACAALGTIDLSGHVMASTCEPCAMCAAAIHWARLDCLVYGASIGDARSAGFRELDVPVEAILCREPAQVRVFANVARELCAQLFSEWQHGPNPEPY